MPGDIYAFCENVYDRLCQQRQIIKNRALKFEAITPIFLHQIGASRLRALLALLLWCTALFASISGTNPIDPD